jgi:hypothetical protein
MNNEQTSLEQTHRSQVRALEQNQKQELETANEIFDEQRRALRAEIEQLRLELNNLRKWKEGALVQIGSLWQETDKLAAQQDNIESLRKRAEAFQHERDVAVQQLKTLEDDVTQVRSLSRGVVRAAIVVASAALCILLGIAAITIRSWFGER